MYYRSFSDIICDILIGLVWVICVIGGYIMIATTYNSYIDERNKENASVCNSLGGVYLRGNCYKSGYEEESIYLEDYYKEVK